MTVSDASILPSPNPEHRRIAAGQFERANQVIATGNFDYGIQLLLTCCKLDPANLIYRRTLRQTEKNKYKNNLRGSRMALLSTSGARARLKSAKRAHDYLKVLEHGEVILTRNPWDTGTQLEMAAAAETLGLLDLAVWILEQARQKNPKDVSVNRPLARLLEKRGLFNQAMALWELVRSAAPNDPEARNKAKDLAASATIARGHYNAVIDGGSEESYAEFDENEAGGEAEPSAAPHSPVLDRRAQEIARYRSLIEKDPTLPGPYLNLATYYRRAGLLDDARAVLEEGLGPSGRPFELITELAELEIEPFRQNLTLVDEKLRDPAPSDELKTLRHRLLKEINTRELDLYRRKSDHFPTDKSFRFELGVRLLRAGQVDEAIRELQAIRNDPRHQWKVLYYLGYCFKSRNNWRLAERNFEEALKMVPPGEETSRKDLLFQLAEGAANAGELAKAVELGFELANLDFGFHDIGRLLEDWQARLHKADVTG
jgi:tetratricopeptide (TPR) repeat protein